ncbi:hypothetical protein ACFVZR_38490 [Streptomyces sp. NPDC058316]|uniref:hypothetical protein n=1 Tax=unclassified Streptomyces TaxID=2593676 RepID=UPI00331D0B14
MLAAENLSAHRLLRRPLAGRSPAPPPRSRLSINLTDSLLNLPDAPVLADADVVARRTGRDAGVRDYVLNTPGAARIITDAVHELTALRSPRAVVRPSSW